MNDPAQLRQLMMAVLYEGCMLYPYRASALKNRRPGWTFGSLLPPAYVAKNPGEPESMQSQLLANVTGDAMVRLEVRFLQIDASGAESEGAIERCVSAELDWAALLSRPSQTAFAFPFASAGNARIEGAAELTAERLLDCTYRLTLRVRNTSHVQEEMMGNRDAALNYSLLSVNALLMIEPGMFISLVDPPDELREAARQCKQLGVFPVLAGDPATRSTMLISPIILYDFPEVAPESKTDFFDNTEIDEMLALRVMTLSDAERAEIATKGGSGREIIDRTASCSQAEMGALHGTFRPLGKPEVKK